MSDPSVRHGKVCYLIMPSTDIEASARFYRSVFDWTTRPHDDGSLGFDDATGQVSGMWVTDRQAVEHPGVEVHIMVRSAAAAERDIVEYGGTLVWRSDSAEGEAYGTFRDPSGNLLGYYQESGIGE